MPPNPTRKTVSEPLPQPVSPKRGSPEASRPDPATPIRRKYLGPIRQFGDREWAVRLGEEADSWCFLLGSAQFSQAQQRADGLRRLCETKGLVALERRASREFTLAIYWLDQPHTCTYATLCTLPEKQAPPLTTEAGAAPRVRVGLIEPDPVLREALAFWLGRIPGILPVALNQARAIDQHHSGVEVVLCNAYAASLNFSALQEAWRRTAPQVAVLGYSVLPTSDDVFVQMSGGHQGYFLRRRAPAELLEPLGLPLEPLPRSADLLRHRFRRYFQNLFSDGDPAAAKLANPYHLTPRETDVLGCLQRGLQDKEIAQAIGISPQTVHTHLKRIFEKLGAHTRTEAVMKFLQK
jgi:DNA-binding NarL/FixJ family response regulator